MSVAIFVGFALKYDLWFLGGFVTALAAVFWATALTWDEGYLPPVPALQSYWIKIHVPLVVTSYAAFMVAVAAAAVYLIKYYLPGSWSGAPRSERSRRPLPGRRSLDLGTHMRAFDVDGGRPTRVARASRQRRAAATFSRSGWRRYRRWHGSTW